jgi:hypothetical protein
VFLTLFRGGFRENAGSKAAQRISPAMNTDHRPRPTGLD